MLFIVGVSFAAGLALYMGWHFTPLFRKLKISLPIVWALSVASFLGLCAAAIAAGGILLGIVLFCIASFVFFDVARLIFHSFFRDSQAYRILQRIYFQGIGAVVLASIISAAAIINFYSVNVTRYSLQIDRFSQRNVSLRVAMISDLHLGRIISQNHARGIISLVEELNADVILLVGDIFSEDVSDVQLQETVSALSYLSAPMGVYYVPGNHEYYGDRPVINYIEDILIQAGVTPLRDEARLIDGKFYLIGREEYVNGRMPLQELIDGLEAEIPVILMDHRPKDLALAKSLNVDLQLSGHTHAGQIFPFGILSELFGINEMNYGLRASGSYHIIVSSGAGGWGIPVRIGSPSEVVLIELN